MGEGRETLLAVDVGNTETSLGLFVGGQLAGARSVTTPGRLTKDEAAMCARAILGELGVASGVGGTILSCVVPTLTDAWAQGLAGLSDTRPLVVGPGLRSGLRLRFDDPSEVGSDRVADAVAAREAYGSPVVAVDLGTTTNVEVVDADGAFLGGVIAPGLSLGARALREAAARLPLIELRAPRHAIGRSTSEAMQAGVVLGEVARIDGLLDRVMAELGQEAPVVMTGEGASQLAPLLSHEVAVDGTLTLRGLWLLWQRNRPRGA